jgi:hypothetical protein
MEKGRLLRSRALAPSRWTKWVLSRVLAKVATADPLQRGLVSVEYDSTQQSRTITSTPAQKRKLGETGFEIADSDNEEYGWDDDEELPPMPSQWQGSEDILLTRNLESDEDDHQDSGQSHGVVDSERPEPDDTESASEATAPARESTP